jgi:hypothetical protein
MDRNSILKILEGRISAASQRNREASARFQEIASDFRALIPHPDGETRIRRAAESYRRAMRELSAAHHEMAKFLIDGTLPADWDGQERR